MSADDTRVCLFQRVVVQTEFFGNVSAGIVENGIGIGYQTTEYFLPLGLFQIQTDTLLVTIEGLKELTVVFTKEVGSDMAPHITLGTRVLHLDDFGTQV